jgi:hypothetical protein
MGASFKKMEALKANLGAITAHKDAVVAAGRQLQLDPNAFVLIDGIPAGGPAGEPAAAPAAAAAAPTS